MARSIQEWQELMARMRKAIDDPNETPEHRRWCRGQLKVIELEYAKINPRAKQRYAEQLPIREITKG